jgi:RNA polymerase sigma-70 factor (ECF subfamily)
MIGSTAFAKDLSLTQNDEIASLVERYQHRLYRYLTRFVGAGAVADDLFQQTWLHVVRQLGRYDSRRSFDTWLFAIAHNAAIDVLRRRPGESLDEQTGSWPSPGPDALDMVLNAERAAIVASEVDALPALYREAVTLRFEEGMKLEEIAEVTGARLSTVKSRLQRALEILRRSLTTRWRKEDLL